jgi:predicted ATPase/transcriptional regulator with XRE-family HTH domain
MAATFGDVLRRYRRAAGLTQEELATRAGLSVRGISDLERGLSLRARKETIELLADALDLPADERAQLATAGRQTLESPPLVPGDDSAAGSHDTPSTPRHNLPLRLTSFVGREREVVAVREHLRAVRVLTLTGTGGVGKTRLALEVADSLVDLFPDGVVLVELAPLADPTLVPQLVASTLGVPPVPGRPVATLLVDHLRTRHLLLILDNCEHLVEACAVLVEALARTCPRLSILATSREVLGVPGEVAWPVPALATPDPRRLPSDTQTLVSELMGYEGVRLLVERARLVAPAFTLTPANAATLAHICRRLDGLPLAIELAAARVKLLSPDQIAERLDNSFELLAGGSRTTTTRHRALWTTIDWSYTLLGEPERALFRRLAVFAGSFGLEAAEAVAGASLTTLGQLVDRSLIAVEPAVGGATRYRLLDPIRQFAGEKLRAAGEAEAALREHAAYFVNLAETAEPYLASPERARWSERLDVEFDNLRVAIGWSRQASGEHAVGLRLYGALRWFWYLRGHLSEGRAQGEILLARPAGQEPTPARARALTSAGGVTFLQGDFPAARRWLAESVDHWRSLGATTDLAHAVGLLAFTLFRLGDEPTAATLMSESVALFREAGNPWTLAWSLDLLGYFQAARRDDTRAHASLTESVELFRQVGDDWTVAHPLANLGYLAYVRGEFAAAQYALEECLPIFRAHHDDWHLPRSLNTLGSIARARGDYERAAQLYADSLRVGQEFGDDSVVATAEKNLARVAQAAGHLQRAADRLAHNLRLNRAHGYRQGMVVCLEGLAGVAAMRRRAAEAARWLAAASAARAKEGLALDPADRQDVERDRVLAQMALDSAAFDAAWRAGQSLTLEQAIEEALRIDPFELPNRASSTATRRQPTPLNRRQERSRA